MENRTSANVMTFFFAFHLNLRGQSDIFGRDDFFFALRLILRRKLDISTFFFVNLSFFFIFSSNLP